MLCKKGVEMYVDVEVPIPNLETLERNYGVEVGRLR